MPSSFRRCASILRERDRSVNGKKFLRSIYAAPIRFYQHVVSPMKPSSCIYYPTCSHYAHEAIMTHGALLGTLLGLLRLLRCVGLFYSGGSDPVPERVSLAYLFGSYVRFWRFRKEA